MKNSAIFSSFCLAMECVCTITFCSCLCVILDQLTVMQVRMWSKNRVTRNWGGTWGSHLGVDGL